MVLLTPRADYAEDQPFSHTILTTHVLHRALTTTPLISLPLNVGLRAYARRVAPAVPLATLPYLPSFTRTTGVMSVIVVGAMEVALLGLMWGKQEVEWQDRSWRLLGNREQQEMDVWGYVGAGVGGVGWAVLRAVRPARWAGWKAAVGGVGLGNFVGSVGEMGWRKGVEGGVWGDGERVH